MADEGVLAMMEEDNILRDEELNTALKAKNREALFEMSLPLCGRFRSDH